MDVTWSNFNEIRLKFDEEIKKCSFIAIDLELSGLQSNFGAKSSLFDSTAERYDKLRKSTEGIAVTQVGVCLFLWDNHSDSYIARAYCFHLRPQTVGSIDQMCTFQASALRFLCRHKFDFNKLAYEGISYLNRDERKIVTEDLKLNLIENFEFCQELEDLEEDIVKVKAWIRSDDREMSIASQSTSLYYKLLKSYKNIDVQMIGDKIELKKTDEGYDNNADCTILNHAVGFSHIIDSIERHKKPLILHNPLMDLICIYKQFVSKLPNSLAKFKSNLTEMFPEIYDTKYMFSQLRIVVKGDAVYSQNSLENVYNFFKGVSKAAVFGIYVPNIKFIGGSFEPWFHYAGWDAYCTGYIFIRLAHYMACTNSGVSRITSVTEHMHVALQYCNNIYLGRAAQSSMSLNRKDPVVRRPILYVETSKPPISVDEVLRAIGSVESVDVKPYNRKSVLVAVFNDYASLKVMKVLGQRGDYKVAKFNVIKHSLIVRGALWSGLVLTSGGILALVYLQIKSA